MKNARFALLEKLVNDKGWIHGAELGVLRGDLFFHLLDHCPQLSLIGVDAWRYADERNAGLPGHCDYRMFPLEDYQRAVFHRAADYGARARVCAETTDDAARWVADGSLDFVFIDADHTEPAVRRDIVNWMPKLKPGGWLMGHDYGDKFPGVKRAVDDLLPSRLLWPDDVWSSERA